MPCWAGALSEYVVAVLLCAEYCASTTPFEENWALAASWLALWTCAATFEAARVWALLVLLLMPPAAKAPTISNPATPAPTKAFFVCIVLSPCEGCLLSAELLLLLTHGLYACICIQYSTGKLREE